MRLIRSSDTRTMPWKNGGGTTTEIAVFPEGASLDEFGWRVSSARVDIGGPFSSFPGIDRTLAVLTGDGLDLNIAGRGHVMLTVASEPYAFAADIAVSAELASGPVTDLNVMTRRGAWSHSVQRLDLSSTDTVLRIADRGVALVFCHAGSLRVGIDAKVFDSAAGPVLNPGDTALADASGELLRIAAKGDKATAFVVHLTPAE